jgi:glycine/D-amino acid oxidase-like deaminating enzyme
VTQDTPAGSSSADVAVIGGGVIGLSTALALSELRATVTLIADERPGSASGAAAGLLAPSIGSLPPDPAAFFAESLRAYPEFLSRLQPIDPELRLIRGLIAIDGETSNGIALTPEQVRELEPALHAPHGGTFYREDAAIDIGRLMRALRQTVETKRSIRPISSDAALRIDASGSAPRVFLASGRAVVADYIVLAAGAWSPSIGGLPRPLPVIPLKGQMLALKAAGLQHPVMGEDVYLVPRVGEIAIGATVEHQGFDLTTSDTAIDGLRAAAVRLMPSLGSAQELRRWAGIRPATPDMLPILGPDPEQPQLIYACGHSKNGILLAPATATVIARLVAGTGVSTDLSSFAVSRFGLVAE